MSHISKPVDWEVYNIPPVQPVQYYSILKEKREFSQFIKKYNAQVFKHSYIHFCGIVPKNISSLKQKYEIFIVFFNEIANSSFIGFRIKVSKETFMHESNSLLLFLKKSKKAVFYLMNNNCIHVQCGTNAWELFYLLYDDYLRKYVLTIIGTQFFYHFVYSYCIQREIQLIEMLYKGSKVIRVSQKSVYYKIHRKRKISVTDLIHMTLSMPKSKRFIMSCFSPKESVLSLDLQGCDFYTATGTKVDISKLILKKYKRQNILLEDTEQKILAPLNQDSLHLPSELLVSKCESDKETRKESLSNTSLKRKFAEIDKCNVLRPSVSNSFRTQPVTNHGFYGNQFFWKEYSNLKPFTLNNYSGIPCLNHIVPNLLKNGKIVELEKDFEEKSALSCENISFGHENNHFLDKKPSTISSLPALEDASFTTAAGSNINISSIAMLKAEKLINDFSDGNKQMSPKTTICDTNKNKMHSQTPNYPYFKNKTMTVGRPYSKVSENKLSHTIASFKSNEITTESTDVLTNIDEGLKLECLDTLEDINFSTAAGKAINVSNNAVQAAKKLIQGVFSDEKESACSGLESHTSKIYKNVNAFQDIGCPSKITDVDMDNTLVEKFFEDTLFDEKDLESTSGCNKKDNSHILESEDERNLPNRKPRKSLGGRRSMRYCSDKL